MKKVAIVAAYRSAIGSFGGSLKDMKLADLGAQVLAYTLKKSNISPALVEEVIIGNVLGAGQGQNVARQIALGAGIPDTTSAFVVNKVCGSGLKAVQLAAQSILAGDQEVVVAGGIEIMSQAPYLSRDSRFGKKLGSITLEDSLLIDGLTDAFSGEHMGITAENIAERYQITRTEQDAFALASQEKALRAVKNGRFADEIVPLTVKSGRKDVLFDQDEYPRETSLEKLTNLRPAFKKDGSVTAGNASGINDGCAMLILMSETKVTELGLEPLAYIESSAISGLDPAYMGLGPITASQKALAKIKNNIADIDLFEVNMRPLLPKLSLSSLSWV